MSSFLNVCKQLHRQRETEARVEAIKRMKSIRAGIAQRQQQAEDGQVRPHDDDDTAERMKDAKARIDEQVQSILGKD